MIVRSSSASSVHMPTSFADEAIKWPELNTHGTDSHALPVHNTGRAGFDTGSEVSFSRAPSTGIGPSLYQ